MTILQQPSTRGILSSTGWFLLTVVLLFSAGAPKAHAQQPNSFEKDLAAAEAILNWASGAYRFISGARTAIEFLTGLDGGPRLTEDIKQTVLGALREHETGLRKAAVQGLLDNFIQVQKDVDQVLGQGQTMDTALDFVRESLVALIQDGTKLFNQLEPILRAPATLENDADVVGNMWAYTVVVPTLVSAMKLVGEIIPSLKRSRDESISEKLIAAQQTLFMAAGAYILYVYEPGQSPIFFYSTVGEQRGGWMVERPLYRYHYVDPFVGGGGGGFVGPLEPFFRYQENPVVKLALGSLERIVNVQPSMVWAERVNIPDIFSSPDDPKAKRADFVFGQIIRVRQ